MIEVEANILVEKTSKPLTRVLLGVIGFLIGIWVLIEWNNDVPEPTAHKMSFTVKK